MKKLFCVLLTMCIIAGAKAGVSGKKELVATRTTTAPDINGVMDDPAWKDAEVATDFTLFQFKYNQPSQYRTEVRVLYDNVALYIGAYMYDPHPDSIMRELSQRDALGSSDFFDVILNPFNDGLNAEEFIVSCRNVQLDAKMYPNADGGEDFSWDAVWTSAAKIRDDGWCVEMKIPYSALRFPNKEKQTWAIQFVREVKRHRDKSSWEPQDPEIQGFTNQMGLLSGIEDIKAPVRLSVSPYFSSYYNMYADKENALHSDSWQFNGGADLKYGLNDAFTLDMTLVPDFGQVQSDNQVLNLTPFETYFVEQRQFFTEGTELFNKGGLFYSRRVGGTPLRYYDVYSNVDSGDVVINNPAQARLLNAAKISGRTPGGLGIGIFNAVEGETYATVRREEGGKYTYLTGPRTNYNEVVFDQNLKNNSYVTLINTNVMRDGAFYDANVSGTDFQINDKKNIFGFAGGGAVSQKYGTGMPGPETGYAWRIGAGKYGGKITYDFRLNHYGADYDPNDLGYLNTNNYGSFSLDAGYHKYKPWWHFNQINVNWNANYLRLVVPDAYYSSDMYLEAWGSFRNYTFGGVWMDAQPVGDHDWFEPRTPGYYYALPGNFNLGGWISTDYSKRFAYDASGNFRIYDAAGRYRLNLSFSPRYRFSDEVNVVLTLNTSQWPNDVGWVTNTDDSVIFGKRNNITYETILNLNYTPDVIMGFSLRLRHYWSFARYSEFYGLGSDGALYPTAYNSFDAGGNTPDNVNFNAFNIDFVYSWFFAPGSELDIVWKNAIYQAGSYLPEGYFSDLRTCFDAPQSNTISVKILYYFDYLYLKKKA